MSQRTRILTQITGFAGWKVAATRWETRGGRTFAPASGYDVPSDAVLVLVMERRWASRCSHCMAICGNRHEQGKRRRWADLPWAGRRVVLEYAPDRVKSRRCGSHATELLAWADPRQRQTRRLQHHVALDAFSMPLSHVATKYGLAWQTVRRAEHDALARWEKTRPPRRTERLWLKYRQAWIALGEKARPDSPGDAWKAIVTRDRIDMLKRLAVACR